MVIKVIMLVVFFGIMIGVGSCICRICRTVWMEIRNCIHMDRYWKCDPWITACMGSAWQKNQTDHAEAGFQNNAGIL